MWRVSGGLVEAAKKNTLRWYGNVEKKNDDDWVKMYNNEDDW
jgi:hypothetical protein